MGKLKHLNVETTIKRNTMMKITANLPTSKGNSNAGF